MGNFRSGPLALVLFVIAFNAAPPSAHAAKCPTPHPRYSDLLGRLDTFTKLVERGQKCATISHAFSDVLTTYSKGDRGSIEKVVKSPTKVTLTPAEVEQISSYSEGIASKVSILVNTIRENPNCLQEEERQSALLISATITQEITKMAASAAGPYQVPIAVGGALIAGILRGIDYIIEANKKGFDFDKSADRRLFVPMLCSYNDIRDEINDLMNPHKRVPSYQSLVQELEIKKQKLVENSPLAAEWLSVYERQQTANRNCKSVEARILEATAGQGRESPWITCSWLSDLTRGRHSPVAALAEQVKLEAGYIATPGEISAFYQYAISPEGVLPADQCWKKSSGELAEANQRSINIIREILKSSDRYYRDRLEDLIKQGGGRKIEDNYVDWMEHTIERIDWAQREKARLESLIGEGSQAARRELSENKHYLNERFFDTLAPRFVGWYLEDSDESLDALAKLEKKQLKFLRSLVQPGDLAKANSMAELAELMMQPQYDSINHAVVYAGVEKIFSQFSSAQLSLGVVNEYCKYFSLSGTLGKKLQGYCLWSEVTETQKRIDSYEPTLKAFERYLEWAHAKKKIEADSIQELIARIRACHAGIVKRP